MQLAIALFLAFSAYVVISAGINNMSIQEYVKSVLG